MKIMLQVEPPQAGCCDYPEKEEKCVEDEVREALDLIESGHESYVEWKLINKLARELRSRKDARSRNLMSMIDPILQKYGMHGVEEKGE